MAAAVSHSSTKPAVLDPAIIGHHSQQAGLAHALSTGRLGHAHLFAGPAGVGKRLAAVALARALLCPERSEAGTPCLECRSCNNVTAGVHPDLRIFERDKSTFSVDLMRDEVLEWAARRPREGRCKIGVIDGVEHLGVQAANAFLKTLEEPPAGTVWILVTNDVSGTLTTIRSRCQLSVFHPLAKHELELLMEGPLRSLLSQAHAEAVARQPAPKAPKAAATTKNKGKGKSIGGFGGGFMADPNAHDDDDGGWGDDDDDDWGGASAASTPSLPPAELSFAMAFAQGSPGAAVDCVREGYRAIRDLFLDRLEAGCATVSGQRSSGMRGAVAMAGAKIRGLEPAQNDIGPEGPLDAAERLLKLLDRSDEVTQEGLRQRLIRSIGLAESILRDVLAITSDSGAGLFNADQGARIRELAPQIGLDRAQTLLEELDNLRRAVRGNASTKLATGCLLLALEG